MYFESMYSQRMSEAIVIPARRLILLVSLHKINLHFYDQCLVKEKHNILPNFVLAVLVSIPAKHGTVVKDDVLSE